VSQPHCVGAIVPHAGWICSGLIAAQAIASVAATEPEVDLVVIFGAIHTPMPVEQAVLDTHARWLLPGAEVTTAANLRQELAAASKRFVVDDRFHEREHAVEVELPFVQAAWPRAMVLPIEVPPNMDAMEIGLTVSRIIAARGLSAVFLASSDLTHYGPNYQFAPAGVGESGLVWALENDRRLLRIVTDLTPERIVPEVRQQNNACGAGAIAAMMSACLSLGAREAVVLCHASSYQTLAKIAPQPPDNAVGYASVWLG
jgi:AmmeMemoRadiSam system protein B